MKARRPMRLLALPQAQRELLNREFVGFTTEEREDLVWSIEHWLPVATNPAPRSTRRHFVTLAEHADELGRLLAIERPLWNTKGIDWTAFESALEVVRASAAAQAKPPAKPNASGRGSEVWRDNLIAIVVNQFPARVLAARGGKARRERVLSILFEALEVDLDRTTLRRILKRNPAPPFGRVERP